MPGIKRPIFLKKLVLKVNLYALVNLCCKVQRGEGTKNVTQIIFCLVLYNGNNKVLSLKSFTVYDGCFKIR